MTIDNALGWLIDDFLFENLVIAHGDQQVALLAVCPFQKLRVIDICRRNAVKPLAGSQVFQHLVRTFMAQSNKSNVNTLILAEQVQGIISPRPVPEKADS